MIPEIRQRYNTEFTQEKYEAFLDHIARAYHHKPFFRIAESPVFVPEGLKEHLFRACHEISETIIRSDFKTKSESALRDSYRVPNEDAHTLFLQMDFGITRTENGAYIPKLIEIQGFPSLYFYQDLVARAYRKFFHIPEHVTHLFDGLDSKTYLELLRRIIIGDEDPKEVILLEVEPRKQVTQIDFLSAEHQLGLAVVCITDLKKEGTKAFYYDKSGKKIQVKRIFNRVIFDELLARTDIHAEFRFTEEVDAKWVGHPNWFFRISKHTLPFLDSQYVPRTWFVNEANQMDEDLDRFVLKPLYSFSGSGVKIHVHRSDLDLITDPSQYILQEKIEYAPVIPTPDGPAKCEIRMLMIWEEGEERPRIVNNLARLSKGIMIGVRYNQNKTWVGGSVAFF